MNDKLVIHSEKINVVNNRDGLVGIASCLINDSLYLGSIGIYNWPDGSYRLTYPTKKIGDQSVNLYHPINREAGDLFEEILINKYLEITKGGQNVA